MTRETSKYCKEIALNYAQKYSKIINLIEKIGAQNMKFIIEDHLAEIIKLLQKIKNDNKLTEEDKYYLNYVLRKNYDWFCEKLKNDKLEINPKF